MGAATARGTTEAAVHLGTGFCLRDEALNRLASHECSGPILTDVARDALRDPHTQVYSDTVGPLQFGDDERAKKVLLDGMTNPARGWPVGLPLFADHDGAHPAGCSTPSASRPESGP